MAEKNNSRKGVNTRAHLVLTEQFYVWRMCEYFTEKIHREWKNKAWHLQGFGNTLPECRALGKYNSFLKALKEDIMRCLKERNYISTPPSETTLENLLGEVSQRPRFFQKQMRKILAMYVGYEDWDDFRNKESLPCLGRMQPNFVLLEKPILEAENEEIKPLSTLPMVLGYSKMQMGEEESEYAEIVADLYFHFFEEEAINEENIPYQEIRKPWAWIAGIGFSFMVGIGLMWFFNFSTDLPSNLSMKNDEKEDMYGRDKVSILFTTQLVGLVELNAYRALPDIDTTWLDLCYAPEAPSRKRIVKAVKRRSITEWTMGNAGNPSNFKVLYFKIIKQSPDSAIVETKERWHLAYWNLKKKFYCYQYDHEDEQIHYLKKTNGLWKVYLVERKAESGEKLIDN